MYLLEFKVNRSVTLGALALTVAIATAFNFSPQSCQAAEAAWHTQVKAGETCIARGDVKRAETQFRLALQEIIKTPHNAEQLAECQNKLANALSLEGKTGEAEILYQNSLAQLEKSYGKNSSKLSPTLLALGSFFEAEGDHSSAMALYQKAININEKSFNQFSPAVSGVVHIPNTALGAIGISPYRPGPAALPQQSELESSSRMLRAIPATKDLVQSDENSDKDLLKDFRNQILNTESADAKNPRRTAGALPVQNRSL